MYTSLSLGPISLPTAPLLAILGALLTLEVAARTGRRLGVRADDLWNTGLIAIIAGLIVARVWNVIQFREIYTAEPWLIISPRPSGFNLLPGIAAGLIAGYANMIRKALDPLRTASAFAVGFAAGAVIFNVSDYLTGAVVGIPNIGPVSVRYFYEMVLPVALFKAALMGATAVVAYVTLNKLRPARTLWVVLLGYGLMLLITEPFVNDPAPLGGLLLWQLIGLLLAVGAAIALALEGRRAVPMLMPATVESAELEPK